MSATKIGGNTTNILNCYFLKQIWNVRLIISMWKTAFSSHKQYLFGFHFTRNEKRAHTDQSILQNILLCLKRNFSQIFKSSSCKKVFLKCVYHGYNLLRWMFSIPCDNWKTLIFIQISRYPDVWYNHGDCCCLLWNKCFERSPHFISVMSITRVANEPWKPWKTMKNLGKKAPEKIPGKPWKFHWHLDKSQKPSIKKTLK